MVMNHRDKPEISDLIVQYDADSGERILVKRSWAIARCASKYAQSIIESIPHNNGVLCNEAVDDLLIQSHLELQRLWEEFFHAQRVAKVLLAMVKALRSTGTSKKIRVVDVGCGIGYVLRWLATHDSLTKEVTLLGVDYNTALIQQAQQLAQAENLSVSFEVANAFQLTTPADIFISSGVLHHCRGASLHHFFQAQSGCSPMAFAHFDPQQSWATPIGSFMFHFSRMRTPLARYDGWLSAVRAHAGKTLEEAALSHLDNLALFRYNPPIPFFPAVRTMTGIMGIKPEASAKFDAYLKEPKKRVGG
jgi:SAM-dependent methyltransferase